MKTKTNNIILRIKRAEDLFYGSAIPLSCKRLLHPDVEEFIIDEAEKLNQKQEFQLTIQIEENSFNTYGIISIIHRHFEDKRETANHQIKKAIKLGLRSLLIGFLFLIIMFLLTKLATSFLPENALMITLRELFIILAWVALWRPADLLLYDWQPYKRNAKLFDKLAKSKVHVTTLST